MELAASTLHFHHWPGGRDRCPDVGNGMGQVLGAGAYGCVCKAIDHDEDDEEVAVKRIEDVFISKTDALRILREVPRTYYF